MSESCEQLTFVGRDVRIKREYRISISAICMLIQLDRLEGRLYEVFSGKRDGRIFQSESSDHIVLLSEGHD